MYKRQPGIHALWAPDVVKGLDGKYYLYYCLDFLPEIGVAVCDTPAGSYEFLGFVKHADGTIPVSYTHLAAGHRGGLCIYYGICTDSAESVPYL